MLKKFVRLSTENSGSCSALVPIYLLLHFLEDNKLIESRFDRGKIVYQVASKGKEKFEKAFVVYKASIQKMSHFVKVRGGISP